MAIGVCFYIDVFTTADTLRVWAVEEINNNNIGVKRPLILTLLLHFHVSHFIHTFALSYMFTFALSRFRIL